MFVFEHSTRGKLWNIDYYKINIITIEISIQICGESLINKYMVISKGGLEKEGNGIFHQGWVGPS